MCCCVVQQSIYFGVQHTRFYTFTQRRCTHTICAWNEWVCGAIKFHWSACALFYTITNQKNPLSFIKLLITNLNRFCVHRKLLFIVRSQLFRSIFYIRFDSTFYSVRACVCYTDYIFYLCADHFANAHVCRHTGYLKKNNFKYWLEFS